MLDEIESKTVHKEKKVINIGKRSKTLNEVKPVETLSKNLQSFLEISPVQKSDKSFFHRNFKTMHMSTRMLSD